MERGKGGEGKGGLTSERAWNAMSLTRDWVEVGWGGAVGDGDGDGDGDGG